MTSTDIATVDALADIERLDTTGREAAVTAYLTSARDRLVLALEATGPDAVVALKAEIATAAEATKQLGLSKEIQTDAREMVRRAEYALGKAIRAAQAVGQVRTPGQRGPSQVGFERTRNGRNEVVQEVRGEPTNSLRSPSEFVSTAELHGTYALVDGVSAAEFEVALSDAKSEGNLSRANVVRKIRGVKSDGLTPLERLNKIRELAPSGMTSGQIARELGVTEDHVRRVARDNRIAITADKVMSHTRRLDHTRFINQTVTALEGLASGLDVLNLEQVDRTQIEYWATSLTESLEALNRLAKQIKEMTQ